MGGDRLVAEVSDDDVESRLGDDLREAQRREYEAPLPGIKAFDEAQALLTELHDRGWLVALASSGQPEHTEAAIDLLGGDASLDGWTSAEDSDSSTPAPDILLAALKQVGGTAAVAVRDSTYDIQAAHAAGWERIAVRSGGFGVAELTEAGALRVFEDVGDLLEHLDEAPLAVPEGWVTTRPRSRRRYGCGESASTRQRVVLIVGLGSSSGWQFGCG